MSKVLAIDPGLSKCGLIEADLKEKKVNKALVVRSELILKLVRKINKNDKNIQVLIGNGTSSKFFIENLCECIPNLIIAEEKNSTFRAKERYFEIFPLKGLKCILPREIFILNKNLDALAALIIMEDFFKLKFDVSNKIDTKTWLR